MQVNCVPAVFRVVWVHVGREVSCCLVVEHLQWVCVCAYVDAWMRGCVGVEGVSWWCEYSRSLVSMA
jgi:hypothetical protein